MTLLDTLARASKLLVALLGVVAQVAANPLVPARYQAIAAAIIALATALGVYAVPNAPAAIAPAPAVDNGQGGIL